MSTKDFSDFTTAGLRTLLTSLSSLYSTATISEFLSQTPGSMSRSPLLVLRHDSDFSLQECLPMANLEHSLGMRATYFILLRSPFYNTFTAESRHILRNLVALGHEVGVHFDPQYYPELTPESLPAALAAESSLLTDLCGQPVTSFSFHLPDFGPWITLRDERIGNLWNAYSSKLFSSCTYCSDSNGYWRHKRLSDLLLEQPNQLYVLLHPEWWFFDQPLSPYDRVKHITSNHAAQLFSAYEKILTDTGRENVGSPSNGAPHNSSEQ
jgi:hypothetical protein